MSLDMEQPAPTLDSAPADNAGTPTEPTQNEPKEGEGLTQAELDEIEEELDGVKLRGKKEALEKIKNERLMQADYTRKTQEVAEQRRAVEQQQQMYQQAVQMQQQFLEEVAEVRGIDKRLSQFQQLDWHALNQQDPQRAQALLIEFNQLQAARGQLVNSLTQKQQQQALQQQHEHARRLQEGRAVLERDIKGWSPELAQKLASYALSVGVPQQVLDSVTDPAFIKLLHKAYLGDQLAKQQTKPPEPPKPVTRVNGGSASTTKPLSEVTDPREWAERRRARKSQTR